MGLPLFILSLGVRLPFQQLVMEKEFFFVLQIHRERVLVQLRLSIFLCGTSENFNRTETFYANCEHTQSGQMSGRITVITCGGREFCMMCLRSQIAILLCGQIHARFSFLAFARAGV